MDDDIRRPLYEDYKKQGWDRLNDDRPIRSRERLYEYADRPMIMFLYFVLHSALFFMVYFLPKPGNTVYAVIQFLVYIFAVLVITLYQRRFVYRYARFNVLWEDWSRAGAACESCDERGNFLPTKENRSALRRSRFAFFALLLAAAAVATLFYNFTWGMAEQRVRGGAQLTEFARIVKKQGGASISVDSHGVLAWSSDGESLTEIAPEDEKELMSIFTELQWNYAKSLRWKDGTVHVYMHGWFQSRSFDVKIGRQLGQN